MTDLEGICGIFQPEQVSRALQSPRYKEGQEFMTKDINVCAEACKAAGADKVYVRDCHGSGDNVFWEHISPAVDYIIMGDSGRDRFPGLADCDGVILLGYHAMAGTAGGVLEHTMSSKAVQNYWINGQLVGETAIDAAIAGERGKPVIMVSGDDKVCHEAKSLLPWTVTACVKKGMTWKGAMLLPPEWAYKTLREKTAEAVKNLSATKPYTVEKPVTFRMECIERGQLPYPDAKPYMKIIDGRIYEVEADSVEEALHRLH